MASIDWTTILAALIVAIPAVVAAITGRTIVVALRTPSGDAIGHVVERTHDLAAVSTAALAGIDARPSLERSVERINDDPNGPVTINGQEEHE